MAKKPKPGAIPLPRVTVDLTKHPLYSTTEYYKSFAKVWTAEIMMFNANTGTMRVRLYSTSDGEIPEYSNMELDISYITDESVTFQL